jgi:hypothetical protein
VVLAAVELMRGLHASASLVLGLKPSVTHPAVVSLSSLGHSCPFCSVAVSLELRLEEFSGLKFMVGKKTLILGAPAFGIKFNFNISSLSFPCQASADVSPPRPPPPPHTHLISPVPIRTCPALILPVKSIPFFLSQGDLCVLLQPSLFV